MFARPYWSRSMWAVCLGGLSACESQQPVHTSPLVVSELSLTCGPAVVWAMSLRNRGPESIMVSTYNLSTVVANSLCLAGTAQRLLENEPDLDPQLPDWNADRVVIPPGEAVELQLYMDAYVLQTSCEDLERASVVFSGTAWGRDATTNNRVELPIVWAGRLEHR